MRNSNEATKPIQGGFTTGYKFLIDYLHPYQNTGVNHVVFDLKYESRPAEEVIQEMGNMYSLISRKIMYESRGYR